MSADRNFAESDQIVRSDEKTDKKLNIFLIVFVAAALIMIGRALMKSHGL